MQTPPELNKCLEWLLLYSQLHKLLKRVPMFSKYLGNSLNSRIHNIIRRNDGRYNVL